MSFDLKAILRIVIKEPVLHAKWLNTFSYLEYIGFRKIVKSQQQENLNLATLKHAAEESRHALLLKNLAVKFGGETFKTFHPETLLCEAAAENYFQKLDTVCGAHASSKQSSQQSSRLTYLYVTWLVELRALAIYSYYQAVLIEMGQAP